MKVSIIIPCYNEEKNISLIVNRFDKIAAQCDIELILVDNGSKDTTSEMIDEFLGGGGHT